MELISMIGIHPNSPPLPSLLWAADLPPPLPPQFYDISINHPKNVIELAESEILNDGSRAIAPELSETASRPLISEKSPEVRKEAIKQKAKY